MTVSKEDYEEHFRRPTQNQSIPLNRVLEKLDLLLAKKDFLNAEQHLRVWLKEAEAVGDQRGMLSIYNELIGFYRKQNMEAEGITAIGNALQLCVSLELDNTVIGATTKINAATAYKAFGKAEEALPLYQKAKQTYESELSANDDRLGGLYNNMALTLAELKQYHEAEAMYQNALQVMQAQKNGEAEMAITWLNLADLAVAELGLLESENKVNDYLKKAEALLETPSLPKNANTAYVFEKCAPVFGYYGYFWTEKKLLKKAEEIYERT